MSTSATKLSLTPARFAAAGAALGASALLAAGLATPPAGASSAPSSAAMSFHVAKVAKVGKVIVDGRGRTVYLLTANGHTNVPCSDSSGCTTVWPALPLPHGVRAAKAGTGLKASLLGTKKVSGKTYPTYGGWLMYEYAGDSRSGSANGQGVKSFGGTWWAINASGHPVTASTSKSSSSGGSGSSGGYGGGGSGGYGGY